jgi:hypothetical protein
MKAVVLPSSVKFFKKFVLEQEDELHVERFGSFGGTVLQKQTLFL